MKITDVTHLGLPELQLWEDLRVDHVELALDLVAPDVVDGADLLVEDQMFGGGGEPAGETRPGEQPAGGATVWFLLPDEHKPLHPGLVPIRLQDRLWSHVDDQSHGVLGTSCLVSAEVYKEGWIS